MAEDKNFTADILWRILDVTRQLSTPIELDDMLVQVVNVARDVLRAERGTVFLYDDEKHELFAEVGTGLEVEEIRFPADQGIAGICARTSSIVNVPDAYSHEGFNPEIDRKMGYRTRCILSIPLIGIDNNLVGVLQLINKTEGSFSREDERVAEVLASQCAVALQRAKLLREYIIKQKIEHDLIIARDIQMQLLPDRMPEIDGYDLAGWNEPADQTGGDIFDAISLDNRRVLLLLADASGHGLGPALSVIQFRAMIRMAFRLQCDLYSLHSHANNQLVEDLASERFITAFVGLLETDDNLISYHACGQAPLLHYHRSTGETDILSASALPFGIMPDIPLEDPGPIRMEKGDIFALISDGIFEQSDIMGDQFGVARTIDIIRDNCMLPMKELAEKMHYVVARHAGRIVHDDDMTILLVKRNTD
ncbi:MAG: SpoIIE family protein phosphatase [Candidatus Aegiribacteria sp.]|nr:SpoIIE family protein phosphatase [Candidatus Aegiribacteria sp.]